MLMRMCFLFYCTKYLVGPGSLHRNIIRHNIRQIYYSHSMKGLGIPRCSKLGVFLCTCLSVVVGSLQRADNGPPAGQHPHLHHVHRLWLVRHLPLHHPPHLPVLRVSMSLSTQPPKQPAGLPTVIFYSCVSGQDDSQPEAAGFNTLDICGITLSKKATQPHSCSQMTCAWVHCQTLTSIILPPEVF